MLKCKDVYNFADYKAEWRMILKTNGLKSYFLNITLILLFSLLYSITGSIVNLISGMMISIFLGYSVTKHHYLFVGLQSALIVFVITMFYSFSISEFGALSGVISGASLVLLGIGLGLSVRTKMQISTTIIMCSAIYLINMLIGFAVLGESISYAELLTEMKNILAETTQAQYPGVPEMEHMLSDMLSEMVAYSFKFMPSILVCSAGMSGVLLTLIFIKIIVKLNQDICLESVSSLRCARSFGIMFIFTIFATLYINDALILDALLNLLFIMCFIFYVCGVSYIDFLIRHKGKTASFRLLTVLVVIPLITFIFALPAVVLVGTGLLDSIIDFRKRRSLKEG